MFHLTRPSRMPHSACLILGLVSLSQALGHAQSPIPVPEPDSAYQAPQPPAPKSAVQSIAEGASAVEIIAASANRGRYEVVVRGDTATGLAQLKVGKSKINNYVVFREAGKPAAGEVDTGHYTPLGTIIGIAKLAGARWTNSEGLNLVHQQPLLQPSSTQKLVAFNVNGKSAREVFEELSRATGIQITIDGPLLESRKFDVSLVDIPFEKMLDLLCQQAGLTWERTGHTSYVVRARQAKPVAPGQPANGITGIEFRDTKIKDIFALLAKVSDLKITVADNVTETLPYIRLGESSAEDAMRKVAQATGLVWYSTGPGAYHIEKEG